MCLRFDYISIGLSLEFKNVLSFYDMPILTAYDHADIHREVAVAILDAFLPHGTREGFTKRVGISLQWYSYIRQKGSFSMPEHGTIRKLADNLPAPSYYQESLHFHLNEARNAYNKATNEVKLANRNNEDLAIQLKALDSAHKEAVFAPRLSPETVKKRYIKVLELGELMVHNISFKQHPLEFAQICSPLTDACYALDKIPNGLYWSKLARRVIESIASSKLDPVQKRESIGRTHFITLRNEGLGYHNLLNPGKAMESYDVAESVATSHQQTQFLSDIYRNRLIAFSNYSRFAIGDAELLAILAKKNFEQTGDHLSYVLTEESLARAYVAHGTARSLKKAHKLLENSLTKIDSIQHAGSLHRVVVQQSLASLYWAQHNMVDWQNLIGSLLLETNEAGLFHQHRKLITKYSSALKSIELPARSMKNE